MSRKGKVNRSHKATYVGPTDVPMYEARLVMEDRYNAILADRLMVEGAMRYDGSSGSGRGTVERAASSVNGTEVRGSARWSQSARSRQTAYRFKVPTWLLVATEELDRDTRTAALAPFERVAIERETVEREARKVERVEDPREVRAAALRRVAGIIRMADLD